MNINRLNLTAMIYGQYEHVLLKLQVSQTLMQFSFLYMYMYMYMQLNHEVFY